MNDPVRTKDESHDEYLVVARRYRPQNFDELIGQQQATKALKNAIASNRVGHAYLFTGARGVGKTSTARIFAKALNCSQGPTAKPCDACDICLGITSGEDVDVLEIDGASNRGIDEIRTLRANVNVRPSRSRFKIYIIDEVHMLTKDAFNALLKTLEEPPEHVKFIFCTTEPDKIPITVLSRCQRFDFAPVEKNAIVARLKEIVAIEGATAEDEALQLLARRAAGSMRDSQSLLEQLLAFAGGDITVETVHRLLGTADAGSVASLAAALLARDAAGALATLDAALQRGVDVGQLTEQLMGYLRDVMAASVGAPADILRQAPATDLEPLRQMGQQWGMPTLLAAVQILDQALARMRLSVDRQTLVETALVRISYLEDLASVASLVNRLQGAQADSTAPSVVRRPATTLPRPELKKNVTAADGAALTRPPDATSAGQVAAAETPPRPAAVSVPAPRYSLSNRTVQTVWDEAVAELEGLDANFASAYQTVQLDGEEKVVVAFAKSINAERCGRPEQKKNIESILRRLTGRNVRVDIRLSSRQPHQRGSKSARPSQQVLMRDAMADAFVQQAMDLFDADVSRVMDASPGDTLSESDDV